MNFNTAGLMARNPSTANGENWIGVQLIGSFGAGPSQRNDVNSSSSDVHASPETNFTTGYLQLTRSGDVFSTLFSTDNVSFALIGQVTRADLPETVQVGLYQGTYSGNQGTATFDDFSITSSTVPEPSTWVMIGAGALTLSASSAVAARRPPRQAKLRVRRRFVAGGYEARESPLPRPGKFFPHPRTFLDTSRHKRLF